MLASYGWVSLTISKGNSHDYNADKTAKPKQKAHFNGEVLKKEKEEKDDKITKIRIEY